MDTIICRGVLALVAFAVLGLAALNPTHRIASARPADSGAVLSFSPSNGSASLLRTVSFAGFAGDEVIDITFYDPNGTQADVGEDTTFYASTEADGTGAFPFRPSDWLSSLQSGWWTVQAVGESSGVTATGTFHIDNAQS